MKTNYGLIYSLVGLLGVGCNPEVVSSTKTSPAATMISGASAIGGPANLTLSGPVSVSTTDCSAFAVSVKDAALHTVAATSALTVDLISSGSGAYFSDSLCTVPILQTFIASGGSSAIVY